MPPATINGIFASRAITPRLAADTTPIAQNSDFAATPLAASYWLAISVYMYCRRAASITHYAALRHYFHFRLTLIVFAAIELFIDFRASHDAATPH